MTLPVSEVFGPTVQGEGPSAGAVAAFIRLGGCNLTCARCDTPYTWDARRHDLRAELTPTSVDDILGKVPDAPLVVVTGGEPLLLQRRPDFLTLIAGLVNDGRRVEVETNATIIPGPWARTWPTVTLNASPKLHGPMSTDPEGKRLVPAALTAFADLARDGRAVWKLVVSDIPTAQAAVALTDAYDVPRARVWLMPEGTDPDTVLTHARAVADVAVAMGVSLTLRSHVLLWPTHTRGR